MSEENFITTFNHGYNGAAFVLLSDHQAEVQRLTNKCNAMREQLIKGKDNDRENS